MDLEWISLSHLGYPKYEMNIKAQIRNIKSKIILKNVIFNHKIVVQLKNHLSSNHRLDVEYTYKRIFKKYPDFKIKSSNIESNYHYKKQIAQYDAKGYHVRTFNGTKEAAKYFNVTYKYICYICSGKRNLIQNYTLKYLPIEN
jgi:hypothetical protein